MAELTDKVKERQLGRELTGRVQSSRFGKEVLGPKVATPLAGWLQETFGDDEAPAVESGRQGSSADAVPIPAGAEPVAAQVTPAGDDIARTLADRFSAQVGADRATAGGVATATETQAAPPDDVEVEAQVEPERSGLIGVLLAVKDRIKDHNLVVVAAGIAFWGLLAIPAVLFATVSIAGLVLDSETVKDQVNENLEGLPEEVRSIIGDQLANVSGGSTGGLITGLVVSLLLALWSSSGAMAKMMSTLNTVYGVTEDRSFPKLRGLALGLTFGGIVFIAGAVFLLAVLPALLANIDGVGESAATLFEWLRFPTLGLVMVIALGVLYHVGPDRRGGRYRPLTIGAVVATVLWVALSGLFSVYTSTLASYNETYGSLGGLVVLLLWLFITAFVVLIGAEIHAVMTRGHTRETAAPAE